MADIFLSYSRADRPTAHTIASALEAEGFSVWWDKVLRAGQTYDEVTESMLRDSSVVVVLWSQTSVKSKWVRAEATLGQRGCELVPAMIEEADRPIMFELTQTADLIGWSGDRNEARWGDFVTDIKRSIDKHNAATAAPVAETPAETPAATAAQDDSTIETVFWTSIKDGNDPADFEAYLKRYSDGHYSDLARNRLAALGTVAAETVEAAPALVPEPEAAPPKSAAPVSSASPASAAAEPKNRSVPLPIIIGGCLVVGIAGWFGLQALMSNASKPVPPQPKPPGIDRLQTACEGCPEMVPLDGGAFVMGSPDSQANRSGNEGPQREVAIRPFRISQTEVTWAQWQICVDDGGCRAAQGSGSGNSAVSGVNYDDAVAYADWLSSKSDLRYRLPSEAQWEFAARGGTQTAYWWGDTYPGPGVTGTSGSDTTTLPENPFGLTGMLGNVREWVADCYVSSYANAPVDDRPVGSDTCARPVVRGGSWRDGAAEHRAANRARFGRTVRDRGLGFSRRF